MSTSRIPLEGGLRLSLDELSTQLPGHGLRPDYGILCARQIEWFRSRIPFATAGEERRFLQDSPAVGVLCWKFPGADPDLLFEMSLLSSMFIWIDDTLADLGGWCEVGGEPPDMNRMLAAVDDVTMVGGCLYVRAFHDVLAAIRCRLSEPMWARLVAGTAEAFAANTRDKSEREPLDYETYLTARRGDVGGGYILWLVEHLNGLDLSAELDQLPELGVLREVCLENVFLVNDLFSFRKEYVKGETMNAIMVLRESRGLSLPDAVSFVCRRISATEREFTTRADELVGLRGRDHPQLASYVAGLKTMLAGNSLWMYFSPRYHGPGHTWDGVVPRELILYPDRTEFVPNAAVGHIGRDPAGAPV